MLDSLSHIDGVLFKRWTEAVAFREAMVDLEDRLAERFEAAAESLRSWLAEQGYGFLEVEPKYARINVARASWINGTKEQPWVWIMLDAVLPYGYRKVQEESSCIWVVTRNLEREERSAFQDHFLNRLRGKDGTWVNDDCSRDYPAGRYLSHNDGERLELARSPETLAAFAREALSPILALGDDIEAALRALGK